MCFEFSHGLADIKFFIPSQRRGIKFTNIRQPMLKLKTHTNIRQPMLKLKTHSGFHELFRF